MLLLLLLIIVVVSITIFIATIRYNILVKIGDVILWIISCLQCASVPPNTLLYHHCTFVSLNHPKHFINSTWITYMGHFGCTWLIITHSLYRHWICSGQPLFSENLVVEPLSYHIGERFVVRWDAVRFLCGGVACVRN